MSFSLGYLASTEMSASQRGQILTKIHQIQVLKQYRNKDNR